MKAMLVLVVAFIAVGSIFTIALALQGGLDRAALIYLLLTLAVGALGIAAVRKASRGLVVPPACPECGGTIANTAPYCKHCGHRLS